MAENNLGTCYYSGKGMARDYTVAAKWYRAAAEAGVAAGQANLAFLYLTGTGLPRSEQEAEKWFRKSAEQGSVLAQASLGLLYRAGRGVPLDYIQSYVWFSLAAARGNQDSVRGRKELEQVMTPRQIEEAQRRISDWNAAHP